MIAATLVIPRCRRADPGGAGYLLARAAGVSAPVPHVLNTPENRDEPAHSCIVGRRDPRLADTPSRTMLRGT